MFLVVWASVDLATLNLDVMSVGFSDIPKDDSDESSSVYLSTISLIVMILSFTLYF